VKDWQPRIHVKKNRSLPSLDVSKAPTGIEGFDEITHGGLPLGRATLVEGGPGSGKTIMALQSLVNGARLHNEPGIFVAFEESSERIRSNAAKFGWDLDALQKKKLFFLDAQPRADLCQSGAFDLRGMLAALEVKVREFGARRIVFDAVDMVLTLLNDPFAERREIFRLHEWLLDHGLTAILTSKAGGQESNAVKLPQFGFMQFMVDCAVLLNQEVRHGVSQRSLRVVKYRGSSFAENESPFLIGSAGLEVAGAREFDRTDTPVTNERLSSGVARLDTMLGGGYYRAASILITGFPGTAKSTLSGAFAEAACERGERTLFVSFDSDANEVVRNLTSVNIRLEPHVKKGLLRLVSARGITGSAEVHLLQIKNLARAFGARCLVIDPISALAKVGNEGTAHSVAERLIDWTKAEGITVVCTSLLDEAAPNVEGTPLQVSTIADTWIHLNYLVHAGERNRGLSIIKSRGTAHSNQVRELVLSETGVTLADAYTAGGEVLMGTLRWEKERAMEAAREETELATERKRAVVEKEEAELISTMAVLEKALKAKRLEKQGLKTRTAGHVTDVARDAAVLRGMRGEDLA
jgi:circadian clock protein KaiC